MQREAWNALYPVSRLFFMWGMVALYYYTHALAAWNIAVVIVWFAFVMGLCVFLFGCSQQGAAARLSKRGKLTAKTPDWFKQVEWASAMGFAFMAAAGNHFFLALASILGRFFINVASTMRHEREREQIAKGLHRA